MNRISDSDRFSQAIKPYENKITTENKSGIMNGLKKMIWYVEIDATKSDKTNALVLKNANIFKIIGRWLSLGFLFKDIYSRKACQEVINNFKPISEAPPHVQAQSSKVQEVKNSMLGSNLSTQPPVVTPSSQSTPTTQNTPNTSNTNTSIAGDSSTSTYNDRDKVKEKEAQVAQNTKNPIKEDKISDNALSNEPTPPVIETSKKVLSTQELLNGYVEEYVKDMKNADFEGVLKDVMNCGENLDDKKLINDSLSEMRQKINAKGSQLLNNEELQDTINVMKGLGKSQLQGFVPGFEIDLQALSNELIRLKGELRDAIRNKKNISPLASYTDFNVSKIFEKVHDYHDKCVKIALAQELTSEEDATRLQLPEAALKGIENTRVALAQYHDLGSSLLANEFPNLILSKDIAGFEKILEDMEATFKAEDRNIQIAKGLLLPRSIEYFEENRQRGHAQVSALKIALNEWLETHKGKGDSAFPTYEFNEKQQAFAHALRAEYMRPFVNLVGKQAQMEAEKLKTPQQILDEKIESLNEDLSSLKWLKDGSEKAKNKKELEMKNLVAKISSLGDQLQILEGKLETEMQALEELRKQLGVESEESAIEQLSDVTKSLEPKLKAVEFDKTKLGEEDQKAVERRNQLDTFVINSNSVKEKDKDIASKKTQVQKAQEKIQELKPKIIDDEDKIAKYETRIQEIESQIRELEASAEKKDE
jgi:hypothetical protein